MRIGAEDIWAAIDQLAGEHRWTVSGLARRAGLDPTAFNRSKRRFQERDRWPASSSIAKVLDVTGESFLAFAKRVTAIQQARQQPALSTEASNASRDGGVRRMRKDGRARQAASGGPQGEPVDRGRA